MKVWAFEGTWAVTGGFCMLTDTKTRSWGTTNRVAEGGTERCRIIMLDDKRLVWELNEQTNSLTRER